MSYAGISVHEAMDKLNHPNGGWYLPYIQRQYVWGERYESEEYVCLLLDSLLRRYPIGGLVLWETSNQVPYRKFLDDYEPGTFPKLVEEGRYGAHKFLVYDGQQRLQTLWSVLYHTFNGRVLHFDLLFDANTANTDETGFSFRNRNDAPDPRYLKMTELAASRCETTAKVALKRRLLGALREDETTGKSDDDLENLVETNLTALWDIFVDTNVKSIAYFSVQSENEAPVNEVFRRLNTGGIPLTQVELVLGEIKRHYPSYEERLWELSEDIRNKSGIAFSSAEILQFFHLMKKGTTRIDASRFNGEDDAQQFNHALTCQDALVELFEGYLWGLFRINHASIVPRWLAVLPLAAYLTALKNAGRNWKVMQLGDQYRAMHSYFLLSQFCDWNTQTMVNAFAQLAIDAGTRGEPLPVEEMRRIALQKNRTGSLSSQQFLSLPWLALKALMPTRTYVFHERKPQIDHIFPLKLEGATEEYQELVDILWNFQPIPAGINNYKSNRHPQEFFESEDGAVYRQQYDFIPEPEEEVWTDPALFIQYRKQKMLNTLQDQYGFELDPAENAAP